jgi:hypothetical protein
MKNFSGYDATNTSELLGSAFKYKALASPRVYAWIIVIEVILLVNCKIRRSPVEAPVG